MLRHRLINISLCTFLVITNANFVFGDDTTGTSVADATVGVSADGNASPDGVGDPCGTMTHAGCCAQNQVFYCEDAVIKSIDCSDLQGVFTWCGWRAKDEIYDCGTSGDAAPGGDPPFLCHDESCEPDCVDRVCGPDGCGGSCGPCAPGEGCDAISGQCQSTQGCGDIGAAGCCDGDTLRFCGGSVASPKLQEKNCAAQGLSCGWSTEGTWYDCSLEAREDPSGVFSRECPELEPPCIPDCSEKTCGEDGCWGSCGECADGEFCDENQTCAQSVPLDSTNSSTTPDLGAEPPDRNNTDIHEDSGAPTTSDEARPPKKIVRSSCVASPRPTSPFLQLIWVLAIFFTVTTRRSRSSFKTEAVTDSTA